MYTYPSGQLDTADALLGTLGTFWAEVYGGGDLAAALLFGRQHLHAQAEEDRLTLLDAVSRRTVRPLRTELCLQVVLSKLSGRASAALPRFDGGGRFDDGSLFFDEPSPGVSAFALPPGLADVPVLANRVTAPSRVWVRGVDYSVSGGVIRFASDPFLDPLTPVREVWAGGTVVDLEAVFWAFRAGVDAHDLRDQFGYVLGLDGPPTPGFKRCLNHALDCLSLGSPYASLEGYVSEALGSPVASEAGVVEAVFRDGRGLCVATDSRVYRFDGEARPLAAPGDRFRAGAALSDAVRFAGFSGGRVPAGLGAYALPPSSLPGGLRSCLVFRDAEVDAAYSYDSEGRVKASFPLAGFDGDVRRFWDAVHAGGVASGLTLARALDVRPDPAGEPTPDSLPARVNPLGLLASGALRANARVALVRAAAVPPSAPGWDALAALRQLQPPHASLAVQTLHEVATDWRDNAVGGDRAAFDGLYVSDGGPPLPLNAMYLEFENSGAAASLPASDHGLAETDLNTLGGDPARDYLRVALLSASVEGDVVTAVAVAAGDRGVHGKPLGPAHGTRVVGAALVSAASEEDPSADVVAARVYFPPREQARALDGSQFRVEWRLRWKP